jgi:hypothetical protein
MHPLSLAGGLALALGLAIAGGATADPPPYSTTVIAPEAEVRCGASMDPQLYPTNRLHKGDVVQVLKERPDGWLEIRPPEGSFSWINTRSVRQLVPTMPNNFVVEAQPGEKVAVLVGTELGHGKPTKIGALLERSAQVRRYQKPGQAGLPLSDVDGTWMPIEPPAAEVRYLRAEAVARPQNPPAGGAPMLPPVATPPAARPGGSSFDPSQSQALSSASPGDKLTHAEVEELYTRAYTADRSGNVQLAIQLYSNVAALGYKINSPFAPQALIRAHFLQTNTPAAPVSGAERRLYPMVGDPPAPPSVRLDRPSFASAAGTQQPVTTAGATISTSRQSGESAGAQQWIGRLRKAGRGIGGRPTYVLQSPQGNPLVYVNPAQGLDLDAFIGQNVELIGSAAYYGEFRANYMVVAQVRPVP